jgi:hypothetical protein
VQEVNPHDVAWLSILAGRRDHGYKQATHDAEGAGMMYPTLVRRKIDKASMEGVDVRSAAHLLSRKIAFARGGGELEALFYMHVDGLRPKESVSDHADCRRQACGRV